MNRLGWAALAVSMVATTAVAADPFGIETCYVRKHVDRNSYRCWVDSKNACQCDPRSSSPAKPLQTIGGTRGGGNTHPVSPALTLDKTTNALTVSKGLPKTLSKDALGAAKTQAQ